MILILSVYRKKYVESGLTTKEIETLLGTITTEETEFITTWNTNINSKFINDTFSYYYHDYDTKDIVKYLEYRYFVHFPIPMSYIPSSKNKSLYVILYFHYLGYDIFRINKEFNEKQIESIMTNRGICVVNAGCGTGKTTTACRKAYEFRKEGVIFVSYTNSSVNEDKKRMYDYPGTSSLMATDKFNKNYVFGTIDKIAAFINNEVFETYDHSIKNASNIVKMGNQHFVQKHIIVDEAQDIDDIRFNFLMNLYFYGGFESITIYGDPRQKVSESGGKEYKKLWIHSGTSTNLVFGETSSRLQRIAFTETYRFKNVQLLNMINSLSTRRPNLHCELSIAKTITEITNTKPIVSYNLTNRNEDEIMTDICNFIKYKHHNDNEPYSEFLVLGPSLENDNKTSLFSRKITSFFRNHDIPCKLFSEGAYESNGILFSTIQSAKGREANYIFAFGMNNYPESFSMIPYDEAESLIFVSHSRACKQMFYINNVSEMILPRGITLEHIQNTYEGKSFQSIENAEEEYVPSEKKSVTKLIKCFDFAKLMESNELKILPEVTKLDLPELHIPNDISLDFFGTMIGLGIQIHSENKLPEIYFKFMRDEIRSNDKTVYEEIKRKDIDNDSIDNISETTKYMLMYTKIEMMNTNIEMMTNEDYYLLTTLIFFIHNGGMLEYKPDENFDLKSYFKQVSNTIMKNYGQTLGSEVKIDESNICGSIDILTEHAVIELKVKKEVDQFDYLQTFLYKALGKHERNHAILINLRLRKTFIIKSNRIIEYWLYLINGYNSIREQVSFTRYKTRKEKVMLQFPNNSFCIDTEFNCDSKTIFEIGIFNMNDPFRSIIQTINIPKDQLPFAKNWLDMSSEMFQTSFSFNYVQEMFKRVVYLYDTKPTLYYYICPVDHSWCNYANIYDVGKITKEVAVKRGTFRSRVSSPKLSDFYNSHVEFLSSQPHLKHHTAMSDSLMLYSILKMLNILNENK